MIPYTYLGTSVTQQIKRIYLVQLVYPYVMASAYLWVINNMCHYQAP